MDTSAPLIPGYPFTIGGSGFTAKDNTVMLGSERVGVSGSEDGQLEVTLPRSVAPGKYELFVENRVGNSDAFPVVVAAPPFPQNITAGMLASVHRTKESKPADAPWPMLGRTANHAGSSSYSVAADATLRWKFTTGSAVRTPPVIGSDETTYVGSDDGYLYAVSPNGTLKWTYKTCDAVGTSPALGTNGTIYAISEDENLYAINSYDGTLTWKFAAGIQVPSSPTIGSDGTVYAACKDDLCAIDPNGVLKWRFRTHLVATGLHQGAPAVDKTGVIYFAGGNCNQHPDACSGELVSVNPDGSQRWRFATAGTIESSPVIAPDGTIFVEDNRRDESMAYLPSYLYAVSPQGKLKWKFSGGAHSTWMPIPAVGTDGVVYASSSDCNLYAIDPKGSQKWAYTLCSYGYSGGDLVPSPVLDGDGTIFIGSLDVERRYTLAAIAHDGTSRRNYVIGKSLASVPALTSAAIGDDGMIYLASNDYSLYAIGKSLMTPPPKLSSVPGKVVISPDKFDFDGGLRKLGSVRVSASDSNTGPITLEKYSVTGDSFSLERTDCEEGQPLYPGKYCEIWFSYWPGMRVETQEAQRQIDGHPTTVATSHAAYRILTTGKSQSGEIVVTTNAQSAEPQDGRVTLVGRQADHPSPVSPYTGAAHLP